MNLGIQIVAYRPMRRGLQDTQIVVIANKYARSAAQLMCKWGLQHDFVILPSSSSVQHIKDNMNMDFVIAASDMQLLDEMTTKKTCSDDHDHYLTRTAHFS